ncbi:MAG: DUF4982 domain-containing protein [Lachnospiraceae bacterium]|nr:DUF4982 domain-containing protein [Lachnospiraceae bacterium]
MKLFLPIMLSAIFGISSADTHAREVINLNHEWQFNAGDGNWRAVDLPHDFQIEQPWVAPEANDKGDNSDAASNVKSRLSPRGFKEMGKGTYRKVITPDVALKGKRVVLDFGGIMLVGDVFLNGQRIGGTDYGYLGFEVDVTKLLKYGEPNEIVVIADTGEPMNSRWYTGGGLYRDVKMITTDQNLYVDRHGIYITTPEVSAENATVRIQAEVTAKKPLKDFTVRTEIMGPDGNVVIDKSDKVNVNSKWRHREYDLPEISIANPQLWDCDNPAMYTAKISLLRPDGSVADMVEQPFGIRKIEFSPEFGMKLNGKKVLLKGIANHHTLGALGAAAYPRAIEKRVQMLKEFGFNHIRSAHNPYSEEFLDICDRNGILVVDELYDKWLTQFAGGRKDWSALWQEDVPEFVKRDRNHPSVVVWSLGNELQGYSNLPFNDWGVTAYKLQKTLLNKYDTTRPVTVAMHPRYRSIETDSIPAPLVLETDIASYNYRYMYFPQDGKRYPDMIFYQSEANLSGMGPNFFEPDNDKVLGLAYWGMIDYLGESLGWPAKGWTNGVFDISLEPKSDAYFIKSMFTDEPLVHIGVVSPKGQILNWNGVKMGEENVSDNWNLQRGDTVKLYTYTNADEVELVINGKKIGRKVNSQDPKLRNRIVWDSIPFVPGKVEAIAYKNGKVVDRHRLETAGKPVKLVATADNSEWKADGIDLQHVRVHAVDSKGRRVPLAQDEITFEVDGDARIAAVTNGDMTSEELNVQNHRRLFNGSNMVILRAGKKPGPVTLRISSPAYRTITLPLTTK